MGRKSNFKNIGRNGGVISLTKLEKPEKQPDTTGFDLAEATLYQYRIMIAYVRYYLKYAPEMIKGMSIAELAEAYNDILFVRKQEKEAALMAGD